MKKTKLPTCPPLCPHYYVGGVSCPKCKGVVEGVKYTAPKSSWSWTDKKPE